MPRCRVHAHQIGNEHLRAVLVRHVGVRDRRIERDRREVGQELGRVARLGRHDLPIPRVVLWPC